MTILLHPQLSHSFPLESQQEWKLPYDTNNPAASEFSVAYSSVTCQSNIRILEMFQFSQSVSSTIWLPEGFRGVFDLGGVKLMWDAGHVIRAVWWTTEAELLTSPLPTKPKPSTSHLTQRASEKNFPSVRNTPGSSGCNLAGDHLRLENVLQKILIASNSRFCLKVKTVFLVL